jgi:hypothetical protein
MLARMKTLSFALTLLVAVSVRAQLPTASPKAAGFDPARLQVLRALILFAAGAV